MRIGIYNRWLHTLGGGEREAGAFAQALRHDHTVELLTHQPVDLSLVAGRLNLALPNVALRTLPFDPDYRAVRRASADYDLFLNISHGDIFVPHARTNLLRVFFPARGEAADDGRELGGGSETWLGLLRGFYRPEHDDDRPFVWTGDHAELVVHSRPPSWRLGSRRVLRLVLHAWRPNEAVPATVNVLVEGLPLGTLRLPPDSTWRQCRLVLPPDLAQRDRLRITIETTTFNPRELGVSDDYRDLGIALSDLRAVDLLPAALFGGRRQERSVADSTAYEEMRSRTVQPSARSYDRLLANSSYTQSWIAHRWSLPSHVIYPPVDVESFSTGPKRNIILSVGRFFQGSHNKKHLPMIAAFRALCDAGLQGWEYHLAGGCDETMAEQRAYLAEVRAAAAGYPVVVHANLSFAELRELYAAASIFWHATGFGEDDERSPESFEHFGITTVEAMAAACVPVVIGKGGQVEIVEHARSGFLWQTLGELQAQTNMLIADPGLRSRLAEWAWQRSRAFDTARFDREVRALVAEYD